MYYPAFEMTTYEGFPAWQVETARWVLFPRSRHLMRLSQKRFEDRSLVDRLRSSGFLRDAELQRDTLPLQDGLVLYVTSRCNLACAYCDARIEISPSDMPIDVAAAALELAAETKGQMKSLQLTFYGGEPTLCTELLLEILHRLADAQVDYRATLISNGMCDANELAKLLRFPLEVRVSLDAPTPGGNGKYRGEGSFSHAVRTIRMAVATGHRVSVRCTVTEDNIGCMEKLVAFCGELGCSRVCFCPVNVEPGSDYRLLDKLPEPSVYADSWLKALQWTAGAIELLEPTLAIIGTPTLRECPSIFILPDGTALAAGVDSVNSPSLQLGNILHDDRHALVERTAAVHAFYRTNARRGCAACNLQYLCCGSLLANRYKAGEATQAGQDYVCQIARSLVAVILPMLLKRAKPIPLPRSFPPDVALFKYRPFFGLMKEDWCGAR